jgi:uncharacterized protein HemX
MASAPEVRTSSAGAGGAAPALGVAAVLFCLFFASLALYAVGQLRGMAGDLQAVDLRLSTLESMNRKLDRLGTVTATLKTMQQQLAETNGSLGRTNRLLHATNGSITRMQTDIRTLSSIRGDIHEMVHKISGSFLFRNVK